MRPPILAGLLLILGIAAALPFRRTHFPNNAQPPGERAAGAGPSVPGTSSSGSPLRVTSDPQQTAENLLAAFPYPSAPGPAATEVAPEFRESYAEKAVELVELPRRIDGWDPQRGVVPRTEAASSAAELPAPRRPTGEPLPEAAARPDERQHGTRPVAAAVRQPADSQPLAEPQSPGASAPATTERQEPYQWQSVAPAPETPPTEELPAPHRKERVSPQAFSAEPASSTVRLPAVAPSGSDASGADAAPQQPQPRRRYFIREPVFDSASIR